MLFPPICQDIAPDILEKYRYLEKLGYFIQGFYMLNPFTILEVKRMQPDISIMALLFLKYQIVMIWRTLI